MTIPLVKLQPFAGEWEACAVEIGASSALFDGDSECWKKFNGVRNVFVKPVVAPAESRVVHGAKGIINAAVNAVTKRNDPAFLAMVDERETICTKCPRAELDSLGLFSRCSLCGCSTWAKVRNPGESCPDKPPRWKLVVLPE